VIRRPRKRFEDEIRREIALGNKIDADVKALNKARQKAVELKGIVRRHMLRREKDLIKDQIPGKEDNIVICPMSELQREVALPRLTLRCVTCLAPPCPALASPCQKRPADEPC